MPGSATIAEIIQPANELRVAGKEAASYKCEDCGKIISAPADQRPPACCDVPMTRIR